MAETFIVGVDGSETAGRAARRAARLAAALDARLHVVCAYGKLEVERRRVGSEEFFFSNEASALKIAEEAVRELRDEYPDLRAEPHTQEGKAADALVTYAIRRDADLIVVGNKRVQGLGRLLGSIAEDVAQKAPCDVYVAHTHLRRSA